MAYDAGNKKDIRRAEKAARQSELVRSDIVRGIMSQPPGRAYIYDRLSVAHIFHSSFSADPLRMAFSEGERNIGLQLLADLLAFCPHQFTLMLQERNAEDGRRSSDNNGHQRDHPDPGRPDSSADSADEVGINLYGDPADTPDSPS